MIVKFENYGFYKDGKPITYSGVIIDKESKELLLSTFIYSDPRFECWHKIAHHSTICLGSLPAHLRRYYLDEEVTLRIVAFGATEDAAAVKVEGLFVISKSNRPSNPKYEDEGPTFPHITLAISPHGKPSMSNNIKEWEPVEPFNITGVIKEIEWA